MCGCVDLCVCVWVCVGVALKVALNGPRCQQCMATSMLDCCLDVMYGLWCCCCGCWCSGCGTHISWKAAVMLQWAAAGSCDGLWRSQALGGAVVKPCWMKDCGAAQSECALGWSQSKHVTLCVCLTMHQLCEPAGEQHGPLCKFFWGHGPSIIISASEVQCPVSNQCQQLTVNCPLIAADTQDDKRTWMCCHEGMH